MSSNTKNRIHSGEVQNSNENAHLDTQYLIDEKEGRLTGWLILLALLSAVGGFLFGYDTGVMSGAMISLRERFSLTTFYQELIISVAIASAAVFAFLAGFVNDWFGRKPVILSSSVLFAIGSALMAAAEDATMLIAGRVVVGAGVGLASMTVPMFIAESAPAHLRGKLVTLNNLFITGGQFVASVVDGIFFSDAVHGWRYMLGIAGIPAVIQFVGFLFMPESPRWLVIRGRHSQARKVLLQLRGLSQDDAELVDKELHSIERNHLDHLNSDDGVPEGRSKFVHMLSQPSTRRALIVGCGLQMFQQLAGINTVMYYSATIVSMSGVRDPHMAVWISAGTAFVNFAFTIVGLFLVERWGRRPLLLISLVGVAVSLGVLAVGFQLSDSFAPNVGLVEQDYDNSSSACWKINSCLSCVNSKQCGFCYADGPSLSSLNGSCLPIRAAYSQHSSYGRCAADNSSYIYAFDYCPTNYAWMATFGLVLYLIFFAPGMGPMPWTINAEIYPLWARSTGISSATCVNWIFNLLVSLTFLTLTDVLTKAGTFGLYIVLVGLAILFVSVYVPETKGKKLEEIEQLFHHPRKS